MAKPTAAWGLDIGQCALKALRLELVDGKPTATAFDYIEHPKILSQPDADPDALTREALDKFLSRNQLMNDLVCISVAGQSGLSRFVKLPPVEESKIGDIVKFEAKQQIPFPLEEVVWDYQKISGGEVIGTFAMETEIGLFAMKREMISKFMGQYNAAGIECHVVQMAPLALTNFATYELLQKGGIDPDAKPIAEDDTPRGKRRCVVVLDVGTDSSNLIITDAGKIIWQRPLPLGGSHFTRALTKEMKLTFAKAEHLKRNAAKSPDLAQILKALRPVLTDFVGEVQRSLGYFANTHRDAHIAYMVGLGSAFRLPGLQKYMTEKLSLDVRKPARYDRLSGDTVLNDPVFAENSLSFPVSYGLALQGLNELGDRKDYGRINTNLLPAEIRTDRIIRAKKPYAAAAAAALLLGTGAVAFGYGVQYSAVKDKAIADAATKAESIASSATAQEGERKKGEGEIEQFQNDVKAIIKGSENRLDLARVHEVIATALPVAGPEGNLNDSPADPTRISLWNTDEGRRALNAALLRMKQGVPLDRANDDDLTTDLAQVNIESVNTRYTDNLKGFLENADQMVMKNYSRSIADTMLESEREKDETRTGTDGWKPKAPEGGGWVFEIRGYTGHKEGYKFLVNALVKNFQKADQFADSTGSGKISKYLDGVGDPVKGRFGYVAILLTSRTENPQSKKFEKIDPSIPYVDLMIPKPGAAAGAVGAPTDAMTAAMQMAGGSGGIGGGGAAMGPSGWTPLSGSAGPSMGPAGGMMGMGGMLGSDQMSTPGSGSDGMSGRSDPSMLKQGGMTIPGGGPTTSGSPTSPTPGIAVKQTEKPKYRHEFVLSFIWRDAAGQTVAQVPGAAAPGGGGDGGK